MADNFTTEAPSLTTCLQAVFDEEVLQTLPQRIVAVRRAKKIARTISVNATLHQSTGTNDDEPQQQQQQPQQTASPPTVAATTGTSTFGNSSVVFASRKTSPEEAAAVNEAAQKEMRTLDLDRNEFVSILSELLIERVLATAAADRERVYKYGGGGGNYNNKNDASLSASSSAAAAPAHSGFHEQQEMRQQATYFSDEDAEQLLKRVWIYEKYKNVMHLHGVPGAAASSGAPGDEGVNNNSFHSTKAATPTSPNRKKQQQPAASMVGDGAFKRAVEPFMFFWRCCPYTSRQQTRTVFGMPRYQLHPDDLAILQRMEQLRLRKKNIEEQAALQEQQRVLLQKQQQQQQQFAQQAEKAAAAVKAAIAEDDADARGAATASSSPARPVSPAAPSPSPRNAASMAGDTTNNNNNSNNNHMSRDEKARKEQEFLEQRLFLQETAELTAMIEELSKQLPPSYQQLQNTPTAASYSSFFSSSANSSAAVAIACERESRAALEKWIALRDVGTPPFPADFLEALPCVQSLKQRIEPLCDYVFEQADVDHVGRVSFRSISELILEREGRLTAHPFRQNLHQGEELVLVDPPPPQQLPQQQQHPQQQQLQQPAHLSILSAAAAILAGKPQQQQQQQPQRSKTEHASTTQQYHSKDTTLDALLYENMFPRTKGGHICSIEGSPHLVLVSDGYGSQLLDVRTFASSAAAGGSNSISNTIKKNATVHNHVIKMAEANLHQPRVLEMSMEQLVYPLLSKRAQKAQLEADRAVARQQHEMQIRRAANSAEQLALSNEGGGMDITGRSGADGTAVSLAALRFATGNDDSKMQRSLRAMAASERAMSVLNRAGSSRTAFSQKVFRPANYLVTIDGSMRLFIHHFDERTLASPFPKEAAALVRLPIAPRVISTGAGLIFIGDSSGHVHILDATQLLVGEPFERAVSGVWRGNHTFVASLVCDKYRGSLQAAIDNHPHIKAAIVPQNLRPEQYQLGGACITGVEPLFCAGTNKFATTNLAGLLSVVDISTMSLIWCTQAHAGSVLRLMRLQGTDNTFVTTGFDQAGIKVWSGLGGLAVNSLTLVDAKEPHTTRVCSLQQCLVRVPDRAFGGSSSTVVVATRLVSADWLGLVKVWDLTSNVCTHSLHVTDAREAAKVRESTGGGGGKVHFGAGSNSNGMSKDKVYMALTAHAAAQFAQAAPIQQGVFLSALKRFVFLGYRSKGVLRLTQAQSNLRAHFGQALCVSLPLSRRLVTSAGNSLRVWGLRDSGDACLSPLAQATTHMVSTTGVPDSPLLLDIVTPFALGLITACVASLDEERIFCATSSGCIAVLRTETGRLLKIFFPTGKGAVAANASVLTSERDGACVAMEDPAHFRAQDPADEILSVVYSCGNRELIAMMADKNSLLVYSDVGKKRTPIRQVVLRCPEASSSSSLSLTISPSQPSAAAAASSSVLIAKQPAGSLARFQLAARAANTFMKEAAAPRRFKEHDSSNVGNAAMRGSQAMCACFASTGSPSIVTLLADRHSAALGVYSTDGETGTEHQKIVCCVDVPVEEITAAAAAAAATASASAVSNNLLKITARSASLSSPSPSPSPAPKQKQQQEQQDDGEKEEGDDTATTTPESKQRQEEASPPSSAAAQVAAAAAAAAEAAEAKKKNAMRALLAKQGYAIFKKDEKKKQQFKQKDFLRGATCLTFLGDFAFLAVGSAVDNTILLFPTRGGVQGRSPDALESRITDFTPSLPPPVCVIHHIEEPHGLVWNSSRLLLYVSNNNSLRVVVYSLARWLRDGALAKSTAELVRAAVDAPDRPLGVLPSMFHDLPRFELEKARQVLRAAENKNSNNNNNNNATNSSDNDDDDDDDDNENHNNDDDHGSSQRPDGGRNADKNQQRRRSAGFFLTAAAVSFNGRCNNSRASLSAAEEAAQSEHAAAHNFAIRSVLFTERLLKDKKADPVLLPKKLQRRRSSGGSSHSSCNLATGNFVASGSHTAASNATASSSSFVVDPDYIRWAEVQPCRVAMLPDQFHCAEGSVIPKDELEHRQEPPGKRFGGISSMAVLSERDLGGAACLAIAYQCGKVLLFSELLSPVGELRADAAVHNSEAFSFVPSLPMALVNAQKQQQDFSTASFTASCAALLEGAAALDFLPSVSKSFVPPPLLSRFYSVEFHIESLRSIVLNYLLPTGSASLLQSKDSSLRAVHALLHTPLYEALATDVAASARTFSKLQRQRRIAAASSSSYGGTSSSLSSSMYNSPVTFALSHRQPQQVRKGVVASKQKDDDDDDDDLDSDDENGRSSLLLLPASVFFNGFALWLSMAWRLGGNDERRWGRFVTWRRLEEVLTDVERSRLNLRAAREERWRLVEQNLQYENYRMAMNSKKVQDERRQRMHKSMMQQFNLASPSKSQKQSPRRESSQKNDRPRDDNDNNNDDDGDGGHEDEEEQQVPLAHLRPLLESNKERIPLEWLTDEELCDVGQKQVAWRLRSTAAASVLTPAQALRKYRVSIGELLPESSDSQKQQQFNDARTIDPRRPQPLKLLDHTVPEGARAASATGRKRSITALAPKPPTSSRPAAPPGASASANAPAIVNPLTALRQDEEQQQRGEKKMMEQQQQPSAEKQEATAQVQSSDSDTHAKTAATAAAAAFGASENAPSTSRVHSSSLILLAQQGARLRSASVTFSCAVREPSSTAAVASSVSIAGQAGQLLDSNANNELMSSPLHGSFGGVGSPFGQSNSSFLLSSRAAASAAADKPTLGMVLFDKKHQQSKNAVRGIIITKQVKPVLAARGLRDPDLKKEGCSKRIVQAAVNPSVARQHEQSVRELVEDTVLAELPHMFVLRS